MTPAAGYVRVSTEKQAESNLSLEAQESKVRAMATVHDAELVALEVDAAESAKNLDRPGVQRILEMIRRGEVKMLIIPKLDRLTRSVRDLADILELLEKKGVSLVSVYESLDTGTPVGRLVINIIVAVAQWEREETGHRTKVALRQKRARGERAGNVPYGYSAGDDGKTLVENPDEQLIVDSIRDLHQRNTSMREIAMILNRAGRRTRRGTVWQHQYVAKILAQ